MSQQVVVSVENLTKIFRARQARRTSPLKMLLSGQGLGQPDMSNVVVAVNQVSFTMHQGEVLALVGESGSGKTSIGRLLTGIEKPTSGRIQFHGASPSDRQTLARRHRRVQMVFQDPYAALNPFNTVEYILARPIVNSQRVTQSEAVRRVPAILETVQLNPPELYLSKRPYELSGGQRQRVVIARALATAPQIIVADEPVSMLDVSVRADVLKLLHELLASGRVDAMLYITHDLLSAKLLASKVMVLYRGKVVEQGPTPVILRHPDHPYTQLLLSSIPNPHRNGVNRPPVSVATAASGALAGRGCPYAPRCPLAMERCQTDTPQLTEHEADHWIACHAVG